jgi:hypothetical protein
MSGTQSNTSTDREFREPYEPGTLVKINTIRTFTIDGFTTARPAPDQCIWVTERIDLESYPSWKDFLGKEVLCQPHQTATIVSFLGRPFQIQVSAGWEYDVYEVLVNKAVCQMFAVNLDRLTDDT